MWIVIKFLLAIYYVVLLYYSKFQYSLKITFVHTYVCIDGHNIRGVQLESKYTDPETLVI